MIRKIPLFVLNSSLNGVVNMQERDYRIETFRMTFSFSIWYSMLKEVVVLIRSGPRLATR
jgi:hypothetical protein